MGSLHDEGQMDDHVGFGDQRVDGCPIQDVAVLVRWRGGAAMLDLAIPLVGKPREECDIRVRLPR